MPRATHKTNVSPKRQRNAAATRQAIMQSARRAFAKAGYAGAGVREIAHGAGVTAMLVNRYFGSKERLFAEAVAESMATTSVLAPQIASAARIGREQIDRHHQKRIAAALQGALAPQRAAVMLSLIAGFQLMRQMLELPALAKADAKTLVKVLAPLFDQLLVGHGRS